MKSGEVERTAQRRVAAMAMWIAFGVSGVEARDLPAIDRLRDAGAATTSVAAARSQADAAVQWHEALGVPTFVWAERGGRPAALLQSIAVSRAIVPEQAARAYLRALAPLYALPEAHAMRVPVLFEQSLPNGGALVKFRNRIDGVEVFREDAAVLLGPERELVAIGGHLSGGASGGHHGDARAFGAQALADWAFDVATASRFVEGERQGDYRRFDLPAGTASADGSRLAAPVRVKPVLFRLPDALHPAWYVEVLVADGAGKGAVDGYAYVIADDDRSLLYRSNLSADATFTYRVFAETTGSLLPLPSPNGRNGFPHPTGTPNGYQAPFVAPTLVTLANVPFSYNDSWLPQNATQTTGNNLDAFADLVAPDDFSAGDVRPPTSATATFDYAFDPTQAPAASATQIRASAVNLFYVNNWLHDWFYDAGFDENAGNAQTDNFGRGGLGNDAIFAEGQDYADGNTTNMLTPADGARPRMRMHLFDAIQALRTAINSPAAIVGVKSSVGAVFGPRTFTVTQDVVLASPADGCTALGPEVSGKIALVDRGNCSFELKVKNAQNANAVAAIIADTVDSNPAVSVMGDDAMVSGVVIPSVFISNSDGAAIKGATPPVNASLASATGVDRDGTLDNTLVAHEWAHYLSGRLIGNGNGLKGPQAEGMGEGWSDFVALLTFVKESDAGLPNNAGWNGTYAIGGYVRGAPPSPTTNGVYYGLRRYPYSRTLAKNPLTFKHIANGVALPLAPAPNFGANGSTNAEVHATGEVWAAMLWECYSNLMNDTARLTFAEAQDRMKRYLVLGLKLTPVTPTLVEARDALLAPMLAQDVQDYAQCMQGFAKRGLGFGAVAPDRYDPNNAGPVESFAAGGAIAVTSIAVSDAGVACPNDVLDNGENGTLVVRLQNIGATTLSATTGSAASSNPHVTFPGGTAFAVPASTPGQTMTISVPVHLANAAGVEAATFTITVDDVGLSTARPVVRTNAFWLNADVQVAASATDSVEPEQTTWTPGSSLPNPEPFMLWQRIAASNADHRWSGPDIGSPQLTWLTSPQLTIGTGNNFTLSFRHRYSFEVTGTVTYDGGQIQFSLDGFNWQNISAIGFAGYNGTIANPANGGNPLAGQPGFVGRNASYPAFDTVLIDFSNPLYAGFSVYFRFAVGSDLSFGAPGWEVDDITLTGITGTPFAALVPHGNTCLTIAAQTGSQQWTAPGAMFATPLTALVKTNGAPAPGVAVTFVAPATSNGASASFGGDTTVTTDGSGIATAPALTANARIGSYAVTAIAGNRSASFGLVNAAAQPTLDVDADAHYDALTDGVMIARFLEGLATTPLVTAGGLGAGATRPRPQIVPFIANMRALLDIDGDGQIDPKTDGVLLLRYLLGFRDAALIAGAVVGTNAVRTSPEAITAYLQTLMP